MKTKIKTISIGIPAHNEEVTIANLIGSIQRQVEDGFRIEKIFVLLDGCSDGTEAVVNELSKHDKRIKLINDGKQKGQAVRLNEIYQLNKSDVIITFDADTVLANENVVKELAHQFENDSVGLVGGNNIPVTPVTFEENVIFAGHQLWYNTRKNINNGSSVHNHHGCISALRGSVAKQVQIPKNIIANDDFLYFKTLELGFTFAFAQNAHLLYREPGTIKDWIDQSLRFLDLKTRIEDHFGGWVSEYYNVSQTEKFRAIRYYVARNPIYSLLAIVLQLLLRVLSRFHQSKYENGSWQTIKSSKLIITQ